MGKPLTDWEVGQELIKFSDTIRESFKDFEKSHPYQYYFADEASKTIGYVFNALHFKSHNFGIATHPHPVHAEPVILKIGDLVKDTTKSFDFIRRVVGPPVFYNEWWYPVISDNNSDPKLAKAIFLEKIPEQDFCPICAEQFNKSGCDCNGTGQEY